MDNHHDDSNKSFPPQDKAQTKDVASSDAEKANVSFGSKQVGIIVGAVFLIFGIYQFISSRLSRDEVNVVGYVNVEEAQAAHDDLIQNEHDQKRHIAKVERETADGRRVTERIAMPETNCDETNIRLKKRLERGTETSNGFRYQETIRPRIENFTPYRFSVKNDAAIHRYYIKLNSIDWLFADSSTNSIDRINDEQHFKVFASRAAYHFINACLHDNVSESVKGDASVCMTFDVKKGKLALDNLDIDIGNIETSGMEKCIEGKFNRPSEFASNSAFKSTWCFDVQGYNKDELWRIPVYSDSNRFPNVTVTNVSWRHATAKDIEDRLFFEKYIESKLELIRQDIGECNEEYAHVEMDFDLNIQVQPTGGLINIGSAGTSYSGSGARPEDYLFCMKLGDRMNTLFNDIPIEVKQTSTLKASFHVAMPNHGDSRHSTPTRSEGSNEALDELRDFDAAINEYNRREEEKSEGGAEKE